MLIYFSHPFPILIQVHLSKKYQNRKKEKPKEKEKGSKRTCPKKETNSQLLKRDCTFQLRGSCQISTSDKRKKKRKANNTRNVVEEIDQNTKKKTIEPRSFYIFRASASPFCSDFNWVCVLFWGTGVRFFKQFLFFVFFFSIISNPLKFFFFFYERQIGDLPIIN